MKTVEIVMPMRKRLENCTVEEYTKYMTWIETREVPDTVKEFISAALAEEDEADGKAQRS